MGNIWPIALSPTTATANHRACWLRLAPGKAADLIALSDDLFEVPAEQIKDCRVELTMVEGEICRRLW